MFLWGTSTEHTGQHATSRGATFLCSGSASSEELDFPACFCVAEVVCVSLGKICLGVGGAIVSVARAVVGVDVRGVVNGDLDFDGVCDKDTKCLPLNASATLHDGHYS